MNLLKEEILVAIDKSHLSLCWHLNLVHVNLNDLRGVLNITISDLSRHNIKYLDTLWIGWINDSHNISRNRNVSLVQEFNSQALVFGWWNFFTLIIKDVEVLTSIDQSEIFGTLNDKENYILDIKSEWGSPVSFMIDVALICSTNNEETIVHGHIYNSISEVKVIRYLMQAVIDVDPVLLIKSSFDVGPGKLSVNDRAKKNWTISTGSSTNCTIIRPTEVEYGANLRLIERVRPSWSIAQPNHLERSNSKVVTIRSPLARCDNVVIGLWVIKLASILIPNSIFAIFTTRDYQVVWGIPITAEDNSIMSFPLNVLVGGHCWDDCQVFVLSVEYWVVLRIPADSINRLTSLKKLWAHHSIFTPDLDRTILTGCSESSTFIRPLDRNNGALMGFSHILLNSTSFWNKFYSAISATYCEEFTGSLSRREPIHANGASINIHDFSIL